MTDSDMQIRFLEILESSTEVGHEDLAKDIGCDSKSRQFKRAVKFLAKRRLIDDIGRRSGPKGALLYKFQLTQKGKNFVARKDWKYVLAMSAIQLEILRYIAVRTRVYRSDVNNRFAYVRATVMLSAMANLKSAGFVSELTLIDRSNIFSVTDSGRSFLESAEVIWPTSIEKSGFVIRFFEWINPKRLFLPHHP